MLEFLSSTTASVEDYKIVREALDKVNMLPMADRSFSTLSGGE